jgi:hypothetical protein
VNHHIEFVARNRSGITTIITSAGVVDVGAAIAEIREGRSAYFAGPSSWDRTQVRAIPSLGGEFLFANWDGTRRNNLHDLAYREPASPQPQAAPVRTPWRERVSVSSLRRWVEVKLKSVAALAPVRP